MLTLEHKRAGSLALEVENEARELVDTLRELNEFEDHEDPRASYLCGQFIALCSTLEKRAKLFSNFLAPPLSGPDSLLTNLDEDTQEALIAFELGVNLLNALLQQLRTALNAFAKDREAFKFLTDMSLNLSSIQTIGSGLGKKGATVIQCLLQKVN